MLLQPSEEGLPVTKVPRSPQRLALQWSQFYDAILEKRLSYDRRSKHGAPRLQPVADLRAIRAPTRLDIAEGQPIAAALGAMIAYEGLTWIEPIEVAQLIQLWESEIPDEIKSYWVFMERELDWFSGGVSLEREHKEACSAARQGAGTSSSIRPLSTLDAFTYRLDICLVTARRSAIERPTTPLPRPDRSRG